MYVISWDSSFQTLAANSTQTTKRVLCAAGDGNAYEWDLQSLGAAAAGSDKDNTSLVRTYEGGKGYLHAVVVSRVFAEMTNLMPHPPCLDDMPACHAERHSCSDIDACRSNVTKQQTSPPDADDYSAILCLRQL